MEVPRHLALCFVLAGTFLATPCQVARSQATSPVLHVAKTNGQVAVSWTGRGSLQSAPDVQGAWRDVLEAPNPFTLAASNDHQFFRVISRWSTRSNLLEANSEMAVAELNGRIYVMGGYPASRVTARTVQVYDPGSNRWSLTTPLPIALNHPMPAVANGRIYVIGGQTDSGNTSFTNTVFEFWRSRLPTNRPSGAMDCGGKTPLWLHGGLSKRNRKAWRVGKAESCLRSPKTNRPGSGEQIASLGDSGNLPTHAVLRQAPSQAPSDTKERPG